MQEHAPVPQWNLKTLRELAQINYGRDARPILDPYGAYPVYGTAENNRFGTSYLYDGDSVVLGRKGTIDRVQFVGGPFWTIDTAYFLSKFSECEPKWVYYVLSSMDLRSLNEATGVPSLAREVLYRLPVLTPPPREQSKIAEVLSTVDSAIAQTEALIAKQQRIKTGLMQDLLTRGIDAHGQLRAEATHAFKDSPIGRIPVEWEVKELRQVTTKIADRDHTTPKYVDDGVLIISPMAFFDDESIDFACCPMITRAAHKKNCEKTDSNAGDIILHRIGAGLGRVRVVQDEHPEYSLLHSLALIRPDQEVADTSFLKWSFRSSAVQDQMGLGMQSIGVPDLGLDKIGTLQFKMPNDLQEQNLIGSTLNDVQKEIDELMTSMRKLKLLKAGLMQDLLTGKVRVTPLLQPTEAESHG
ncbi:MAG: restriction endonuclease subunit S [Dokdonella sp.]|uniref:restriction endonuclease subunit S n=1 Tax=Dokdonella sp. TaxID=2291710 RepID=UPI0025B7F0DF|nr:restriction endonuclease subunit S [Dokdonella sp.]MBK8124621.1 restriction endonuclease subunit S [Dokdonella sp.]